MNPKVTSVTKISEAIVNGAYQEVTTNTVEYTQEQLSARIAQKQKILANMTNRVTTLTADIANDEANLAKLTPTVSVTQ